VWSVCLILALANVGARAAAETLVKDGAQTQFDSRIDTWMEGTIVTLDADGAKFQVRGAKLPYASAYAEMMKDILDKTQNLDADKRQVKTDEVRKAWADRLAKARTEKVADKAGDFGFAVEKDATRVMSDKHLRGADFLTARGAEGAASNETAVNQKANERAIDATAGNRRDNREVAGDEKEAAAMLAFKDLKIGDRVLIGYDLGMVTNVAYAVVKRDAGANK